MYQQALLSWGNLQYEESQMVRVKQHTCSDAWHMGSAADPILWLGGGMYPICRLITQVTLSPAFYHQAQYCPTN